MTANPIAMSDHSNLIKWYVKREEVSHAKNAMHKKVFLETLQDKPYEHIEGIKKSMQMDIMHALPDVGKVTAEEMHNLPWRLVQVYKQHFLYGNKINLDYTKKDP
jgi:hypothetical protein